MRVRSVWRSARHASDWPSTARSAEIDWAATMGISRDCRVSANIFSSPAASSSPTVPKVWVLVEQEHRRAEDAPDRRSISAGQRLRGGGVDSTTPPSSRSAQMIGLRFTAAAQAAGVESRVTAYSRRVGLASELRSRGASTTAGMLVGMTAAVTAPFLPRRTPPDRFTHMSQRVFFVVHPSSAVYLSR